MRKAAPVALVLALLAAPLALAQEGPAWAGHFMSEGEDDLELVLTPRGDAVEGALTRGASVFEVTARANGAAVEGTWRILSDGPPRARETVTFTTSVTEDGALALTVDGATMRLVRVPGSPRAQGDLEAVLARLLSPGGGDENEASAARMLELLVAEQRAFRDADPEGDGKDFATLEELAAAGAVDTGLARGLRKGYRFQLVTSQARDKWLATASPVAADTGRRHLAVTHEGVINASKAPFALDPACQLRSDAPMTPLGAGKAGPLLGHVRPGQRFVYAMTNAGAPKMEMIYRVREVGDTFVKYETSMIMDMGQGMAPVGEPNPMEWRYEPAPLVGPGASAPAQQKTEMTRETVTISGVAFDCLVITASNSTVWVPMSGDQATFPGLVKCMTDGQTTMELVRIE